MNGENLSGSEEVMGLLLTTVLLPLVSFFICAFISARYSWIVGLIASLIMFCAAITATFLLTTQWHAPVVNEGVEWFTAGSTGISAAVHLDDPSVLMIFVVSLVSFVVHLYSIGYMAADMNAKRYFSTLGLFTFAMLGIVSSESLLVLFVFWELVGFSSYVLIGHYSEKLSAASAARKAFLFNRIGDVGFVIGLMIIWANVGSFNLTDVLAAGGGEWKTWASLCIFCGVMGKSAQFPLSTWLADAMEGPTPVSALIHAATMVAAGVYIMVRLYPLHTDTSLPVIALVGGITALSGAVVALFQYDIKKILAYSTISQLGFMLLAVGVGAPDGAFLHLLTHAFFKGCLFLGAGAIIHAVHQGCQQAHRDFDVQDIRNLGGLKKELPITFSTMAIAAASLSGVPLFSGFLSKEAILAALWRDDLYSWTALGTVITIAILTIMYTFRLMWHTFFRAPRAVAGLQLMEAPTVMRVSLYALATGSLWFVVSPNPASFQGWILPAPEYPGNFAVTMLSFAIVSAGFLIAWVIFRRDLRGNSETLRNNLYIDSLFRYTYQQTILRSSAFAVWFDRAVLDRSIHLAAFFNVTLAHIVHWVDREIVDGLVRFFTAIVYWFGGIIRGVQGGKVQRYVFWSVFTIIIFIIWTLD